MKRRRTFVAINLPSHIRGELASYQDRYPELPARWVKEENLHVTLLFLGSLGDEEVAETCRLVKEAATRTEPFSLTISKVRYEPEGKPPKFVWATVEKSEPLSELARLLRTSLGPVSSRREERAFFPHITLARVLQWQFRRQEEDERVHLEKDIELSFPVDSVDVMESKLKKGGPSYETLEKAPLK